MPFLLVMLGAPPVGCLLCGAGRDLLARGGGWLRGFDRRILLSGPAGPQIAVAGQIDQGPGARGRDEGVREGRGKVRLSG